MSSAKDETASYAGSNTDQEMNFPNPLARTDLPVKRRRWPKVVVALVLLVVLVVVFLPQILATPIGRKFVVRHIAGQTNCAVVLEGIKTSWFGGTTIQRLSIKDNKGRKIGFDSLTCQASLLDLLRGKYPLGKATVNGLTVEYLLDDGAGRDSFDLMAAEGGGPTGGPRMLPRLSGEIEINNGTVVLHRENLRPDFTSESSSVRFSNVSGTVVISSLDKPIQLDEIEGQQVLNDLSPGRLVIKGPVHVGRSGRFDFRKLGAELTIEGWDLHTGPLAAVLLPKTIKPTPKHTARLKATVAKDPFVESLGGRLSRVKIVAKGDQGKIAFSEFVIDSAVAHVDIRPQLDLSSTPVSVTMSGGGHTIRLANSRDLAAEWLVHLNPFLKDAVETPTGTVELVIDHLESGLGSRKWRSMSGQGTLEVREGILSRYDYLGGAERLPVNLASQVALLTGGEAVTAALSGRTQFTITDGVVVLPQAMWVVGKQQVRLEGSGNMLDGTLAMALTFAPAPALESVLSGRPLRVSLLGTFAKPALDYAGALNGFEKSKRSVIEKFLEEQIVLMRAHEARDILEEANRRVENRINELGTTTTQPSP